MNEQQTSQRYGERETSTIGTPDPAANLRLDSTMEAQMGASCPASCLYDIVCWCVCERVRGVLLTRQIAFFVPIFLAEMEITSSERGSEKHTGYFQGREERT